MLKPDWGSSRLNEFEVMCHERRWPGEVDELSVEFGIGAVVARAARKALLELSATRRTLTGLKRAMRVVQNFSVTVGEEVTFEVDLDPLEGSADSGNLAYDLRDLLVEVGEAAEKHGSGFALILDELHHAPRRELEALIMGLHRAEQMGLPVTRSGRVCRCCPSSRGKQRPTPSEASSSTASVCSRMRRRPLPYVSRRSVRGSAGAILLWTW